MSDEFDDGLYDDPFDDDDEWWREPQEDKEPPDIDVQSLLREMGIDGYEGIIVDFNDINPEELRGQRFDTLDEAIIFLHEIGVLNFGSVVEMDDGTYGVTIDDCTNPPC